MGISPLGDSLGISSDVRSTQESRSNQVEQSQQTQTERRQTRQSDNGQDSVNLSSLGSELARSLATETPDEINRVDQLQQAVNSGTLQASSQDTAARVVDDAVVAQQLQGRHGVEAPPAPR